MIEKLYYIIIGLFMLGAILMALINHLNPRVNKRKNWIKYATYFFVVNVVLSTAAFFSSAFIYLSAIIILFGIYEILSNTFKLKKFRHGLLSLIVFLLLAYTLIEFSFLPKEWILYTVFTVFIFDAFSQIVGQLFGKRKILPVISPNKTLEGLLGGVFFGVLSAFLLRQEVSISGIQSIFLGLGISSFAFTGDLMASYSKRKFGIKDFGRLLPATGGFLDRFDSLLFTSLFLYFLMLINFL